MIAEQHIVEKVSVDVNVNSIELAEKIKSEINDFIQNEVLSIVESYFDGLNLPEELKDKVIQLDRVDLSVDASSWKLGSSELKQAVRTEVEKQMDPIIEKVKERKLKHDLSLPKGYDDIRGDKASVYSKEERVLRSMFYFLDHGILPWWVKSVGDSRELFTKDSLIAALREHSVLGTKEFQKRRSNQGFRKRLVQQFPIPVVMEMIQNSLGRKESPKAEKAVKSVIKELKRLPNDVSVKTLDLLVELSDPRIIGEVFQKRSSSKLFEHIYAEFFSSVSIGKKLESTLKTTMALLRVLYLFAGKENALKQMKLDFQESLNQQLSSEDLTLLKKTEAYQKLFSTPISEEVNEVPNQKANLKQDALENIESSDEKTNVETDSISEFEKEEVKGDIENSDETKVDEISRLESEESISKPLDEQSSSDESLVEERESTEAADTVRGEDQFDTTSGQNDPQEAQTSDQNSQSESVDEELESAHQREDGTFESNSDVGPNELARDKQKRHDEIQGSIESSTSEDSEPESKLQSESKDSKLEESQPTDLEIKAENDQPTNEDMSTSEISGNDLDAEGKDRQELSEILRKRAEEKLNKKKKEASMPSELFVENAGLVLLNPFLPALFKQLRLVGEDGKLVNPELAACILHYAATGREGDFEFEMTFEKYLCGIPPTVSIERDIKLTEEHKEEVAKVLNSVLEHWSALKSKSSALLQNEFLTRAGKLIVEKSNHRLVIEKKTFDLLLDKLPWSYSLIKFSWKKELIFVEW